MHTYICIIPTSLPVGTVVMFAGKTLPASNEWTLADGQILQISDNHTKLSFALSTAFGGDGFSTFALPDLRGRHPIGRGRRIGRVYHRFHSFHLQSTNKLN